MSVKVRLFHLRYRPLLIDKTTIDQTGPFFLLIVEAHKVVKGA
jgi:hypothetical protein